MKNNTGRNRHSLLFAVIFLAFVLLFSACENKQNYTVSLDNTTLSLVAGETSQLNATVKLNDKTADVTVEWSTSNSEIATVTDGLVAAVSEGTANITASYNGKSAVCEVTVSPQQIKNIIIMIGDGMGPNQEEAARIFSGNPLAWDSFPYTGTMTTNTVSGGTTDSAASGTALSTGVKTSIRRIKRDPDGTDLKGVMDYAQEAGKRTGVITSKFLYDATPAAFSAYADERQQYEVIKASQIESGIDLLIGEALKSGEENYDAYETEIIDAGYEYITDGNMLDDYADAEKIFAPLASIVPTAKEPNQFELESLTEFGLEFLDNDEGFVLMVEGGKIDDSCHATNIERTINEVLAFHWTVKAVLDWAEDRNDTMVIVTADHETGDLHILPDADSKNIKSGNYTTWNNGDHTSTPVNYYAYGAFSTATVEIFDNLMLPEIDNTDIIKMCLPFISSDKLIFNVPEEAEINYLEEFNIPIISAYGAGNKEYPAQFEVKDSTQNVIDVQNNKFTATDLNGYTITYTVVVDGETFSKTMTLSVYSTEDIKLDFEVINHEELIYNDSDYTAADRQVTVSRVAYSDAGINAPEEGGLYGIKILPVDANAVNFVQFFIDTGRPVVVGTTVSFKFYLETSLDGTYSVRFNNNKDSNQLKISTENEWIDVTYTYEGKPENSHTPNAIQVRVRFHDGYQDRTQLNIYLDNIVIN